MSNTPIKVAIHGAAGRMGQRLVALGSTDEECKSSRRWIRLKHPQLGRDAGVARAGCRTDRRSAGGTLDVPVDVVIDFSTPGGADGDLGDCVWRRRLPLVVATTGLDAEQQDSGRSSGAENSAALVAEHEPGGEPGDEAGGGRRAALKDHPSGADVEIIERHHRFKEDAPSGTALKFGEIIADEMGQTKQQHGREGRPGKRPHDEIGYHAVRTGDNPGEHTIDLRPAGRDAGTDASGASNRDCYAHGALAAAKFLARQAGQAVRDATIVLGTVEFASWFCCTADNRTRNDHGQM